LDFEVLVKQDQDNSGNFEKIKSILQNDSGSTKPKVINALIFFCNLVQLGRLIKEKQASPFSSQVESFIQSLDPEVIEIGPLIQDSLCVKESEELVFRFISTKANNIFLGTCKKSRKGCCMVRGQSYPRG